VATTKKLYLHEPESRAMTTWRSGVSAPLLVTHHGRVELGNGIALAAHLGYLTEPAYLAALKHLKKSCSQRKRRIAAKRRKRFQRA
jgi:hypothetical protein